MGSDTTLLSSKGQVVIPVWIRRALELAPGAKLTVEIAPTGERAIVLRCASGDDLEQRLEAGYKWIKKTGVNMVEALHNARRKEKNRDKPRRP